MLQLDPDDDVSPLPADAALALSAEAPEGHLKGCLWGSCAFLLAPEAQWPEVSFQREPPVSCPGWAKPQAASRDACRCHLGNSLKCSSEIHLHPWATDTPLLVESESHP